MKTIIAVLSESPLYFTMTLRDRYGLVKRLASKKVGQEEQAIDLTKYELRVSSYLNVEDLNLPQEFMPLLAFQSGNRRLTVSRLTLKSPPEPPSLPLDFPAPW